MDANYWFHSAGKIDNSFEGFCAKKIIIFRARKGFEDQFNKCIVRNMKSMERGFILNENTL